MGGPAPKTPKPANATKPSGTTQTPARARDAIDRGYSVKPYPLAKEDYILHTTDLGSLMRGPIPIGSFFTSFVPLHGEDWDQRVQFGALGKGKVVKFSEPHIRLRALQLGLCKGPVHLADTHNISMLAYPDGPERVLRRPDMIALSENLLEDAVSDADRLRDLASLTEWFVDLKKATQDPFGYYAFDKGWTLSSKLSEEARGQFAMYGHMMFVNGHRVFAFGVVIMPKTARLLRFDRSGIVFSERFDWRKHWALPTFIHRYERMSRAERGWDTSVSRLSLTDSQALLNDAVVRDMIETLPKQTVQPLTLVNGALFKFEVWDEEERSLHTLIAGLPQIRTHALTGRSTRGYIAYDLDEKCLVYMKDSFRVALDTLRKESEVYRVLEKAGVPNLPGFLYGGDVPAVHPNALRRAAPGDAEHSSLNQDVSATIPGDSVHASWKAHPVPVQTTRTDEFNAAPWFKKRANMLRDPEKLIHHRIVLKKIGRPLRDFESPKQLAVSICDAVEAHAAAYVAGVLHRDISGGNILVDEKGHGMLIDWELSRFTNDTSPAHREYRTGTWAFMAAELCEDQRAADHLLRHDFESFVHVLFYHVFRYCKMEGAEPQAIHLAMCNTFEDKTELGNSHMGGDGKKLYFADMQRQFEQRRVVDISPIPQGLKDLLADTRAPFGEFYKQEPRRVRDSDRQKRAELLEKLARPSYFFEDIWKPSVYDEDAWLTHNDHAAADQFPPARVKQWDAARRGKVEPKTSRSTSKRQKLMNSEPMASPHMTRSGSRKIPGVDSMSANAPVRPGDTAKLGKKRKLGDTTIVEEDEDEEDDGEPDFEPVLSEDEDDDDDYVEDLNDYTYRP